MKKTLYHTSSFKFSLAVCTFFASCLTSATVYAQSQPEVHLTGRMGSKAVVVVNGSAPKVMSPGQEHMGIKLESMQGDTATFSYKISDNSSKNFQRQVGKAPVKFNGAGASSNNSSGDTEIVLTSDNRGHFITTGYINNKAITFMVDTGATSIAIDKRDAIRMGIKYEEGEIIGLNTANGYTQGWKVKLDSVRVQNVELRNVEAVVGSSLGAGNALLGNSFLKRFDITQTNNQMVLKRRY